VHHRTIQINHQSAATIFQFIILTFIYSSTCFGLFPAHHQELKDCSGSIWFYFRIVVTVVLCSWADRPVRPRTQHDYHHDTKVKPEAATAVIELRMMGGETPETWWAVNKHQDNKLKNCCIWLVIYVNCTMMHGLTNLKSTEVLPVNGNFWLFFQSQWMTSEDTHTNEMRIPQRILQGGIKKFPDWTCRLECMYLI
jgi:hypothetical protein